MPFNNMPQRPTNHNNESGFLFFDFPKDTEAFRRDNPERYKWLMAQFNEYVNYYVNETNALSPERAARIRAYRENPNSAGCFPAMVLDSVVAMRALLLSTPTKYSFCPIRRIVCCCCPNTITGHVKGCCPIPVRDIASFTRDHAMEYQLCFTAFLSFFLKFNKCTTDAERDALMAPYQEKIMYYKLYSQFCGNVLEENVDGDATTGK